MTDCLPLSMVRSCKSASVRIVHYWYAAAQRDTLPAQIGDMVTMSNRICCRCCWTLPDPALQCHTTSTAHQQYHLGSVARVSLWGSLGRPISWCTLDDICNLLCAVHRFVAIEPYVFGCLRCSWDLAQRCFVSALPVSHLWRKWQQNLGIVCVVCHAGITTTSMQQQHRITMNDIA